MQRFILSALLGIVIGSPLLASEAAGKRAVGRDYRKRLMEALPEEPAAGDDSPTKIALRKLVAATARVHAAYSLAYSPTMVPVDTDPRTGRLRTSYSAIDDLIDARKLHARGLGPEHPADTYDREHEHPAFEFRAPGIDADEGVVAVDSRAGESVPGSPATPSAGARRIRGQVVVHVPMLEAPASAKAVTPKSPTPSISRIDSAASGG